MSSTLDKKLKQLSAKRLAKINTRAKELITEEMTLRDLRHAMELTQQNVGENLHMKQDGVSRLERRSDLLLSTLRQYIHAMGGELKISAKFPDRPPIILKNFSDIDSHGSRVD